MQQSHTRFPGPPQRLRKRVRLAGLSALLTLLAGSVTRVYAAPLQDNPQAAPAVAQTGSPATAQAEAAPAPVSADATTEPAVQPVAAAVGGKKDKKKKKEKAPKLTPVHIEQGTLTVDGWTGKARLNYDIADLKYIYVWAPGIGTLVASHEKFPLGKEEPNAFNGSTLTLEAGGHIIQISSEKKLLKEKKPAPAYVYLDTNYKTSSAFPEMGYGNSKDAPYAWPGAKEAPVNKGGVVAPPPLPAGLRPTVAHPSCSAATATPVSTGSAPAAGACANPAAPAATPSNGPAAAPPVPLPGYGSGTTTADAAPASSTANSPLR